MVRLTMSDRLLRPAEFIVGLGHTIRFDTAHDAASSN
jgi:hypothetical protein